MAVPKAPARPTGIGALLLGLLGLTDLPDWVKTGALVLAGVLGLYWLWLVLSPRFGVQSPVVRKRPPAGPTPEDQERMNTVRHLKENLRGFFHSWGNPAMQRALSVAHALVDEMNRRESPWPTCGVLFSHSAIDKAESAETRYRREVEGTFWNDDDVSESLKAFGFERDVETQKPLFIALELLFYVMDYGLLIQWNYLIAGLLGGEVSQPNGWRRAHAMLVERLQELLGIPEMPDVVRHDVLEVIALWP
jgi:hypothetical protein